MPQIIIRCIPDLWVHAGGEQPSSYPKELPVYSIKAQSLEYLGVKHKITLVTLGFKVRREGKEKGRERKYVFAFLTYNFYLQSFSPWIPPLPKYSWVQQIYGERSLMKNTVLGVMDVI